MSFLKKFGKKDKPAESAPSPKNGDDIDIPSAAERGDEPDDDDDSSDSSNKTVQYVDYAKSVLAQRQGVLPHLTTRPWGQYSEDDLRGTKVRGATYDKDKVKVSSGPSLFKLAHTDIFYTAKGAERVTQISKASDSYANVMYERRAAAGLVKQMAALDVAETASLGDWEFSNHPLAPTIIINICFPGPKDTNMNLVMYFERRVPPAEILSKMKEAAASNNQSGNEFGDETLVGIDLGRVRSFDTCLRRFRQGSDQYRDTKLKIIPRVAEGGYIVRKTIGRVPAILGKKLKQTYTIDEAKNFIEITSDVGTSAVAGKIITLIKSKAKSLVVDLTFLLQGDTQDELSESVLGGIRVSHCDLDKIPSYEANRKDNVFPEVQTKQ